MNNTTWAPESDELMISTPVVISSVPVASASFSPDTVEIRYRVSGSSPFRRTVNQSIPSPAYTKTAEVLAAGE